MIEGKIKFIKDDQTIERSLYQSPRGIRFGDKRPDRIVIECKGEMSIVEFCEFIEYMHTLLSGMDWKE